MPQCALPGLDDIGRNVKAEDVPPVRLNRKVNPLTRQTEIVSLHGRNLTAASVNEGSGLSTFARAMTLTPTRRLCEWRGPRRRAHPSKRTASF